MITALQIRAALFGHGWSHDDIAARAGTSCAFVAHLLAGRFTTPDYFVQDRIERIGRALARDGIIFGSNGGIRHSKPEKEPQP